jgi:protein-S-isoprenylcysteine O-methyltransferase Ste14
LAGTVMLAGSIGEFLWRGETLRWPTFIAGWICAVLSLGLRRWAIAALGQYWSLHVEIRKDHRFVQSGPFRWMRHPTYCSMVMELLALGLILNAIYVIPVVAAIFIPTMRVRLRLEEDALIEKFGDAYLAYRRRTPALFPYKYPNDDPKCYDSLP